MLRHGARAFSTNSRPIRSSKFVDALLRDTREPVWRLVTALNTPRSVDLQAALRRHGVSVDQFSHWRPIVVQSNISAAVDTMNGVAAPSWLVLYLIAFKIRTHDNAFPTAVDLAYAHLPAAPVSVQGPLLILTLLGLARFNILLPMRRVVDEFLLTNLDHPQLYFNLLLQALACTPARSRETANAVVAILRRMDARQLKLSPVTYDALLNDRFVTLQLTKYLRERMTREGTVPTAEHLESYLRVFSTHGVIHKAHDYLHAIHALSPKSLTTTTDAAHDPLHRANTLFLAAQDDRSSAFTFLRSLLASPTPSSPTTKPQRTLLPSVSKPDIYTFTSALAVAARDHSLSAPALLALFHRISAPSAVTYTVLLRGLLARGPHAYTDALRYWKRLYTSGLPLDREALGAGLQVLTRAGMPHRAFALLEELARPNTPTPTSSSPRIRRPIPITSITLNDFLLALLRTARPDIVFRLWDSMRALYGVHPDARTLSLVLQAARLARRLDDASFGGAVVRLGRAFRGAALDSNSDDADGGGSRDANTHTDTGRISHASHITTLLGPPTPRTPKPYKPALWHGRLPYEHALLVFQQALFGSARDPEKLLAVRAPACAVVSEGARGGYGVAVGLPRWRAGRVEEPWRSPGWGVLLRRRRMEEHKHGVGKAKGKEEWPWEPRYPSLAPTNENCLHYILLLGLAGRSAEVALVLAWMREVGIVPRKGMLGAAMVLWGEVCCARGVLWTRGSGGGAGEVGEGQGQEEEMRQSEYGKLVKWLEEWLEEWRMPGARELAVWTRNMARLREGGREVKEDEEAIEEAVGEGEGKAQG